MEKKGDGCTPPNVIVSHFWEEKMGNVGAANDLCVNLVVPLREQTCLWGRAKNKKNKWWGLWKKRKEKWESEVILIEKPALYLLYSGTAYVRTDDKNVTILHHAGGQPTFTSVPVIKHFFLLAIYVLSLLPAVSLSKGAICRNYTHVKFMHQTSSRHCNAKVTTNRQIIFFKNKGCRIIFFS